jgi:hypothetical protein
MSKSLSTQSAQRIRNRSAGSALSALKKLLDASSTVFVFLSSSGGQEFLQSEQLLSG